MQAIAILLTKAVTVVGSVQSCRIRFFSLKAGMRWQGDAWFVLLGLPRVLPAWRLATHSYLETRETKRKNDLM